MVEPIFKEGHKVEVIDRDARFYNRVGIVVGVKQEGGVWFYGVRWMPLVEPFEDVEQPPEQPPFWYKAHELRTAPMNKWKDAWWDNDGISEENRKR